MSDALTKQQAEQVLSIVEPLQNAANVQWLLYCGALVLFMQAGFAMLCAGSIRAKNAQNILLKNLMDACVGALCFWSFGYAFAYGERADLKAGNWFIGNDNFFLSNGFEGKDSYAFWFFQFTFAATAATIVSGAVAERCQMAAYAGYSAFLTAFVYPVVVHWVWSSRGWLSAFKSNPILNVGVIDFAGCGVVHMVGGAAAGIGAYVLGPRRGRFGPGGKKIQGHSTPLVVLGTFILWIGWYGFNPGSTLMLADLPATGIPFVAEKTAVTTTLAAASGGLTNLFVHHYLSGFYDVGEMCNGVLAGLVSITAGCSVVEVWAAVVIGFVGAFAYTAGSLLLEKLEIDDAVNATPVHYFCGVWGLIATALFARGENMRNAYGNGSRAGLFYTGQGEMLACNVLALVVITAWVTVCMFPFFTILKNVGLFRVTDEMEVDGLDASKHGGSAYKIDLEAMNTPTDVNRKPPAVHLEKDVVHS
mmetsp:Transcript_13633/g.42189  ORF Transcript_13633/g.42189 Transcript_13633/m.42189 type:complete len:475 (-) Transcript_13633:111-1535(-)